MSREAKASAEDRLIGERIRVRRLALGIKQPELAEALGVSAQQIQKFERGHNRLTAGRLMQVCHRLHCEPNDLLSAEGVQEAGLVDRGLAELAWTMRCLHPTQRRVVSALVKALAAEREIQTAA